MLTLDRSSDTPVRTQLAEQLRYQIVSGDYAVGDALPSTRKLAEQVDVSFHTVRKAYQDLQSEGLVESRVGSGYTVTERVPLGKEERMERGAGVVHEALQRLIGLGLSDPEVEYLFQEQMGLLEHTGQPQKLVFVERCLEMATLCAEQVQGVLQRSVEAATPEGLARHEDADFLFAPHRHVHAAMKAVPRADVLGIVAYLQPEALEHITRLLAHETLGLVTASPDTIQPLMADLRAQTGFSGQMIAASTEGDTKHLAQFIGETDRLACTPAARRRLEALLDDDHSCVVVGPVVSRESLDAIRAAVPA